VYVGNLDDPKERHPLRGLHAGVWYSRTGHLLFSSSTNLMAQPFDVDRLDLTGDAVEVADGVYSSPRPNFAISNDGSLAFLAATTNVASQLAWVDGKGNHFKTLGPSGDYEHVRLSHDNRFVAFDRPARGRSRDILVFNLESGGPTTLVSNAAADFAPVWGPRDERIAFSSSREPATNATPSNTSAGNLYGRAIGGDATDATLLKNDGGKTLTDWSRNGLYLAYNSLEHVWALPYPASGAQPMQVTKGTFVESGGRFSPDGGLIAYESNDSTSGKDVYVQSFPDGRVRWPASVNGGVKPRWNRDGSVLFYVTPNGGRLMSVTVKRAGSTLQLGNPEYRFTHPAFEGNGEYEVADDGRFLLNVPLTDQPDPPVTVIVNWAWLVSSSLPRSASTHWFR
jgi:Tol biopolymer transport system component